MRAESGHFLEMDGWKRSSTFEFFLEYQLPFFNLCTSVEVGPTLTRCREAKASFFLASWYACLQAANETAPFRHRVRDGRVWVHDELFIGTTVLRDDDSFGFCYLPSAPTFAEFSAQASRVLSEFRTGAGTFEPLSDRDDLLHGSVIPWVDFTSMSHARRLPMPDSVPKLALGKYTHRDGGVRMPVSVEVHHAVCDGLHVGQYLERLQALFHEPDWV
jgi:chloramphenicol O-acetyltransferase type A